MDYPLAMLNYPVPDPNMMNGPVSIATACLVFLVHYFTVSSEGFLRRWGKGLSTAALSIHRVLYQRLLGTLLFGLVPLLMVLLVFHESLARYGLSMEHLHKSLLWWIPVALLVVMVSYLGARSRKNLAMYPQIRTKQWSRGLLALSALSWISYLAGYEFLFRGFLLFSCLESFGYWPALVINLSLYSLVHVPRGSREAFGSLLFGFLLCYLTLYLGSIWFALLTHIVMALSNEWFSLGFQPEMKLIKNGRKK
jgi:membrane protease YdiL (CAAX protease family)